MSSHKIEKSAISNSDLEKINAYTRKHYTADELYTFNVTLCDNDIDRDFEKFSIEALQQMKELFLGKTGICDHSMKSADQKARIFDTYIEKINGKMTADGEPYYCLKAKAYMLKNDENKALIDDIDAGIKKEVSVSCSMGSSKCSICSKDKHTCNHMRGKSYNNKLCYTILSDATDAYEFSFVAVPAQREAGVTKSFCLKGEINMNEIIKSIKSCGDEITLSKSQANELCTYINDLKEEARLGEEYKKQLAKDVTKLFAKKFPQIETEVVASVADVMTTKELIGFKKGLECKESGAPQPQLMASTEKMNKNDYSQFRI
jgi:hypothetical protein